MTGVLTRRRNAWRREAAALLRGIAKRIAAGEAMLLILMDREGRFIGKARELSYQPEPARQSAREPPPPVGEEQTLFRR